MAMVVAAMAPAPGASRLSYFHGQGQSGWGRTSGDVGTSGVDSLRGQTISVRDGVVRCLQCHVTNPRQFRNPDAIGPGPEAADAGIGCERCHGPGGNHVLAVENDLADRALINIGPGAGEAATVQCRDCHVVGDASEIRNRREEPIWVRSPGITLTFSRCYTESSGALSCLTCHDPHRDAERSAAFYERKCLACHGASGTAAGPGAAATTRTVVCKVNPARDCLNCHMPRVPMPVLHTGLTDHFIRVHQEGTSGPAAPTPH